jgi:hypothetical protein
VVARVHLTTDEYGFRNSPPEKATYGIVAVGDSYTFGHNVAAPWPQRLAEHTGIDVLNLGEGDTGPQAQVDVLRTYGLKKQPQWVIMAYFEGNDLHDVETYAQASPLILARFGNYILGQGIEVWHKWGEDRSDPTVTPVYRYPITLTINETDLEMAFVSSYISWLSVSREVIESSRNYSIATRSILQAQDLSEAAGSRFLLVYLPSKEHLYLPHLSDADIVKRVFTGVRTIELGATQFLQNANQTATLELTRQHMNDQAQLLADFAAQNHIQFLDLTPYFQKEASGGIELYYPFDTHWNQQGQDLAAERIANYVEQYMR